MRRKRSSWSYVRLCFYLIFVCEFVFLVNYFLSQIEKDSVFSAEIDNDYDYEEYPLVDISKTNRQTKMKGGDFEMKGLEEIVLVANKKEDLVMQLKSKLMPSFDLKDIVRVSNDKKKQKKKKNKINTRKRTSA